MTRDLDKVFSKRSSDVAWEFLKPSLRATLELCYSLTDQEVPTPAGLVERAVAEAERLVRDMAYPSLYKGPLWCQCGSVDVHVSGGSGLMIYYSCSECGALLDEKDVS